MSPMRRVIEKVTSAVTWPMAVARSWLDERVPHPAEPARWAVDPDLQRRVDHALRASLAPRQAALQPAYRDAGEFVVIPDLIPAALLRDMVAELPHLQPARSLLPQIRQAGSAGYPQLQQRAPTITAVYRSPVFKDWCAELAGHEMFYKADADPHAAAVYFYTRPGDWMDHHYDGCGCEDNSSYTLIIGLEDRSNQQFLALLHRGHPARAEEHRCVTTAPGTGIMFCGSKIWHGVSRLGIGERRTVLSLSYTTGAPMRRGAQITENIKDALLYFGPSALWARHH
jgi:hypothetical protein